MLLERLIVNRPHPWGLLITFIELIKNPRSDPMPQYAAAMGPAYCPRSPVLYCLGLMHTTIQVQQDISQCKVGSCRYNFWTHAFTHCAPEIERLFESVARSCMQSHEPAPAAVQAAS